MNSPNSALEPGSVRYMMSKGSYLTDYDGHNGPHLMFYQTAKDDAAWGANLTNSAGWHRKTP